MPPSVLTFPEVWSALLLLNIVSVVMALRTANTSYRERLCKRSIALASLALTLIALHLSNPLSELILLSS